MSPAEDEDRREGDAAPTPRGYLLDTDVLSDLLRHPRGSVAARIGEVGEDRILTSVVVAGELRYGAHRSGSRALVSRVEGLLAHVRIAPLALAVASHYARVRAELAASGTPIGPNDLWIAAHALALDATVATGNTREFARVSDLDVADWLRG
jgi:tRNA(fMet)-specific endonuclease VapC